MAHGGDELLILLECLLLVGRFFENGSAHFLDALGQPRQLVIAACHKLQLQVPVSDLPHLV